MTWHVAYSEPSRVFLARDQLVDAMREHGGGRVFVPFDRVLRRTERCRGSNVFKLVEREEPLFDRYVFVECDAELLGAVRRCRGVFDLVRFGSGGVATVPDAVMSVLLGLGDAEGLVSAVDMSRLSRRLGWRVGDRFSFGMSHPSLYMLVGEIASLSGLDEDGTIKAWVELFGRSARVDLSWKDVGAIIGTPSGIKASVMSAVGL